MEFSRAKQILWVLIAHEALQTVRKVRGFQPVSGQVSESQRELTGIH